MNHGPRADSRAVQHACVIGLGYIGLPTAAMLATSGIRVTGVDINPQVVQWVSNGNSHILEAGLDTLVHAATRSGNLVASPVPVPADAFIIAVPTPLGPNEQADLSSLRHAAEVLVPCLRSGNLVVLESTVPPGTTSGLLRATLEQSPFRVGRDLFVAHCPERVLPGRILSELIQNDRVIGGVTPACAEAARALYSRFTTGAIHLTDATTAEVVKLAENTYRDVNIALANEMARACEVIGVDVGEVIRFANQHPRVSLLQPGPGVGGHCISVDPWFLIQAAPDTTHLLRIARQVNDSQPCMVAAIAQEWLRDIEAPTVALLGIAYKGNVDDMRESPAIAVARHLITAGIEVRAHDPLVRNAPLDLMDARQALAGCDLAVILADHDAFMGLDPDEIGRLMRTRRLLDTRRCIDPRKWETSGFVVKRLGDGRPERKKPAPGASE